jgi:hypothetical protein
MAGLEPATPLSIAILYQFAKSVGQFLRQEKTFFHQAETKKVMSMMSTG